jgi:sugar lactone lactonase YvrE
MCVGDRVDFLRPRRNRPLLAVAVLAALGPVGDGPPRPDHPSALASDAGGNLYVADLQQPVIFRLDLGPRGDLGELYRGSPRSRTVLRAVRALATGPDGALFAADSATSDVYRVRAGQLPLGLTGGALEVPTGLAVSPTGDVFVTDLRLGLVARVPGGGGPPVTVAKVPAPRGVALTASGDLAVLSMGPDQLLRVTPGGKVTPIVAGRPFRFPVAVAVDRDDVNIFINDGYAATAWAVTPDGKTRPPAPGFAPGPPLGAGPRPVGRLARGRPRRRQGVPGGPGR